MFAQRRDQIRGGADRPVLVGQPAHQQGLPCRREQYLPFPGDPPERRHPQRERERDAGVGGQQVQFEQSKVDFFGRDRFGDHAHVSSPAAFRNACR